MKESKIILKNGNPCLCIGDEQFPACAYITYFEERNEYEAFSNAGFKIYSVSISLASQPINTKSGFMPYERGVFDVKGKADFSSVDDTIQKILAVCPNAYIFPRIYVCMPQWWIDENPEETIPVPHNKRRESLYSDKFREDASAMLKILVEHFKSFDAADHIFGYQISGGNTQEWFHLDLNGSYCDNTLPYFNRYLKNKYPDIAPLTELPDIENDVIKEVLFVFQFHNIFFEHLIKNVFFHSFNSILVTPKFPVSYQSPWNAVIYVFFLCFFVDANWQGKNFVLIYFLFVFRSSYM